MEATAEKAKRAETETSTTTTPERNMVRKSKAPSKYDLPSERFGMNTHFAVLRRMMAATGNGAEAVPAPNAEGNGVPIQAASLNAAFLTDVGLLASPMRGMYKPTPAAVKLMAMKSISDDRARPVLRELIGESWFAVAAKAGLGAKPQMTEKELLGDIASYAATDFEKKGKAIGVLLEYLLYAGIVVRNEDGTYSAGNGSAPASPPDMTGSPVGPTFLPTVETPATSQSGTVTAWENLQTNDFSVRVRATKEAIGDLRDHLVLLEKKLERKTPTAHP
jgi:hypothetical protein